MLIYFKLNPNFPDFIKIFKQCIYYCTFLTKYFI